MPCTSLAMCGGEGGTGVNIVTGGEDGRISVLSAHSTKPLSVIGRLQGGSMYSLRLIDLSTVLVMFVWGSN